jgi:presenilin-like A22 family membrane protease
MKHTLKVTLILLSLFLITQVFGIITISKNIEVKRDAVSGLTVIEHRETVVGEPPKSKSGSQSVIFLTMAIIVGTLFLLLLIKLKIKRVFKYWYFFAVVMTISVTLGVYIKAFSTNINTLLILTLAIITAWFKVHKGNVIVHNISEILVYTGIAVLFVRLFEGWLWAAFLFLIIISLYDMFAVWKSKHMIKLAQYQTENKVFAGLKIPYKLMLSNEKISSSKKILAKKSVKVAVLGGGDIAFPLIFSGSVMSDLILRRGLEKAAAVSLTMAIPIATTFALLYLLVKAEKNKFYPAMPFLTAGCIVGYWIILLFVLG